MTQHPADLARLADEFCRASIRDHTGRAARMLTARPELADYSVATAVVLGDAGRIASALAADPGLATRPDPRTGWTALHAVCGSRWHQLDPDRADGLVATATALLDSGADPGGASGQGPAGGWTPLRCAVAGTPHPAIVDLLLERGAVPDDDDLYLAGFHEDEHRLVRLLIERMPPLGPIARMALAAPLSRNDTEGIRLLLAAGADPGQYSEDQGVPYPVIYASVQAGCAPELVRLLLDHGGDPAAPGPDGRSPHALAVSMGRADLAGLLRRYGAADDASGADRLLHACLRGDRAGAYDLLERSPSPLTDLTTARQADAMIQAAEAGSLAAVRLMLEIGFDLRARGGSFDGEPLHAAAYAGSAEVVAELIERGADVEARDGRWESTPVDWAAVGSGERPACNPRADWLATVRALIGAGASLEEITLDPDGLKQPSAEVAALLREHGVRELPLPRPRQDR